MLPQGATRDVKILCATAWYTVLLWVCSYKPIIIYHSHGWSVKKKKDCPYENIGMPYIFHEDSLEVSSLNQYKFVSWYCLKDLIQAEQISDNCSMIWESLRWVQSVNAIKAIGPWGQSAEVTVTCLCVSSFQHRVRKPHMYLKFNDIKCVSGMKTFECMRENQPPECLPSEWQHLAFISGASAWGKQVCTAVGLYFPQRPRNEQWATLTATANLQVHHLELPQHIWIKDHWQVSSVDPSSALIGVHARSSPSPTGEGEWRGRMVIRSRCGVHGVRPVSCETPKQRQPETVALAVMLHS